MFVRIFLNDFLKQRLENERERRQSVQLATEFHAFKLNAFILSRVIELVEWNSFPRVQHAKAQSRLIPLPIVEDDLFYLLAISIG